MFYTFVGREGKDYFDEKIFSLRINLRSTTIKLIYKYDTGVILTFMSILREA